MKTLGIGAAALAMSLSLSASAGERQWYFGIEGGVESSGKINDGYGADTGYAVLATIGRTLGPRFSLEGEFGYRSSSEWNYSLIDIEQVSVILSCIYELPVTDEISLSLGAGVGVDDIQIPAFYFYEAIDDIQFATQLKVGLNLQVNEGIDVSANYRSMTTFRNEIVGINNSTLTVGLRISF